MLIRTIYVSSAIASFSEPQLKDLLKTSRQNNLAADITGMLVHKDGKFMQTLEGPGDAVRTLVETIRKDPRHHKFTTLMEGPILNRAFGNWSMGFKAITPEILTEIPGYHDSDDFSLMSGQFLENPPRSLEFLIACAAH